MTLFTVYDPSTGEILRSGFVLVDADAAGQATTGEAVLTGVKGNRKTEEVDITQDPPVIVPKPG